MDKKYCLGILIVNYNVSGYLKRCLESIRDQLQDIDYIVSIFDNASSDDSLDDLDDLKIPYVLTKSKINIGFGRGINQASRKVEADYYLILNPDTIIVNSIIQHLLSVMSQRPNISILGCPMVDLNDVIQPFSYALPSALQAIASILDLKKLLKIPMLKYLFKKAKSISAIESYVNLPQLDGGLKEVECVPGSGFLVRSKDFRDLGGYDENIFLYMEDCDLYYRFSRAKRTIALLRETGIVHFVSKSFDKTFTSMSPIKHWSTLYYFKKNGRLASYVAVRIALTLDLAIKSIFTLEKKKKRDLLATLKICVLGIDSFSPFGSLKK